MLYPDMPPEAPRCPDCDEQMELIRYSVLFPDVWECRNPVCNPALAGMIENDFQETQ